MGDSRERPILFSGPMVRAILEGRKTQTRRVCPVQPFQDDDGLWHCYYPWGEGGHGIYETEAEMRAEYDRIMLARCPYGEAGDRLWVREAHYRFGHWEPVPGVRTKTGRQKWRFVADTKELRYEAPPEFRKGRHHKDPETKAWHLRLPRFMPRGACRLVLPVVDVRLQWLQDISEADARAEGIDTSVVAPSPHGVYGIRPRNYGSARDCFADLWDSINGKPRKRADGTMGPDISWSANPMVYVVTFSKEGM